MNNFQTLVSKIISVLFHPLLMPTYALLIIFSSGTHYSFIPYEGKKLIFIIVTLSTFIIPISIIPFLINLKVVADFSMEKGKERFFPLLITSLSYFFSYYLLHKISYSTITFIEIMILASGILVSICFIVSFKWKISAHLIGIGGLLGAMFFYAIFFTANFTLIIVAISLIAGSIAFARLQLHAHSPSQVYTGFITGFAGMILILYLGMN